MKHLLLTTIAAVMLVGCLTTHPPDISIHEASSNGNIEAVKQHLAAGTNVDEQTSKGRTPLHFATQKGHKEIVELLITNNADVNVIDHLLRFTPVDWAVFSRKKEIAELLRKHGGKDRHWFASEKSIHVAARVGHIEAVKKHLEAGVDVNVKGQGGIGDATPLHYASRFAKKEIVKLIIANGANVNARNDKEWTPLHIAALGGHKTIVELLISKGADVNAKDNHGRTPLNAAEGESWRDSLEVKVAKKETADLLRKHGGKTGDELKAEGK